MTRDKRKALLVTLIMLVIISLILPALANTSQEESDISGHWAEDTLKVWVDNGYLDGFGNNEYQPDGKLTRAQFISFINKLFEFSIEKENQFVDVEDGSWYEKEVIKAIANGYIVGFGDNTFRPDSLITRIEAAAVLTRLVDIEENLEAIEAYSDYSEIPLWGISSVSVVIDAGLMSDFISDTFGAKEEITRAEAIVSLQNAKDLLHKSLMIDESGVYGPEEGIETYSDIYIGAPDVTLQNTVVLNDLVIGEEVGDGDVTLNNVEVVNGSLLINGGGTNSIHINGGQYNSIRIESTPTGGIRVVATGVVDKDGNEVDIVISENVKGRKVILEGDFDEIVVESSHVSIETLGKTNINKVSVKGDSQFVKVTTSNDTNINTLENETEAVVRVRGTGNVNSDMGKVTYGIPTPSSSTKTPAVVKVNEINVTASAISIEEDGGSLQMSAEVLPENADNKDIIWSVITNQDDGSLETGFAFIDQEGLLIASADGTVKVVATADDDSDVTGELSITISNQNPEVDGAVVTIREGSIYFQYSFKQGDLVVDYKLAQDV
ncbi:MAG: S-layer homology domain-containing protein [Clostridia bacterium]